MADLTAAVDAAMLLARAAPAAVAAPEWQQIPTAPEHVEHVEVEHVEPAVWRAVCPTHGPFLTVEVVEASARVVAAAVCPVRLRAPSGQDATGGCDHTVTVVVDAVEVLDVTERSKPRRTIVGPRPRVTRPAL